MSKEDREIFEEGRLEGEMAKLKDKIITSRVKTSVYTDIEIKENNGITEYRPVYPDWAEVDIAVANIDKDREGEEKSIRMAMETALSLQSDGQKHFQDKEIEKFELIHIPTEEAVKKVLVLLGETQTPSVLVQEEKETGELVLVEKQLPPTPIFQILETENEKGFELFKQELVKKSIRVFLNHSPECHRLHSYCMTRLGLTKSREHTSARLLHSQYTHATTNIKPENEQKQEGLMGVFPSGK